MASTIRGTFLLIDRASDTLRKIESQAIKTQAAVEGVGTALDKQQASHQRSAGALENESRGLRSFQSDLSRARQEVDGNTKAHREFTRAAHDSTSGIDKLGQKTRNATNDMRNMRVEHGRLVRSLAGAALGAVVGFMGGGPVGAGAGAALGGLAGRSQTAGLLGQKDAVKQLQGAFGDLKSAMSGLVSGAFSFLKIGTLVTGIQPAIAGITSLGGAVAGILPRLAQLGNAFYALPGAISVGVQAFGTFGLAMQGISQALGAAMQMQNQWGYNQQQWAQQVIDAQNGVLTAHNALTNAIWSQNQAQIQLTIARRDASRELQDMEFQARSAVLQETQAGLTVMQARMTLQSALSTAGTSQLQISQDRLSVEQAILGQQQQQVTTGRAQADLHRARTRDPTSQVTQQVAQAQHQAAQSVFETAQAERALARAQYELNHLFVTGNSGVNAYRQAMRALQPAQRQFVQFLTGPLNGSNKNSFLNQFQRLQQSAASGLFPGIERGLSRMRGSFGAINDVLFKTGGAIGGSLEKLFNQFADPAWIEKVGTQNAKLIATVGDGVSHVAGAFKGLIRASEPFMKWVAHMFDEWAKAQDRFYNSEKGQRALAHRFAVLKVAVMDVWHVLKDVWRILINVGKAADQALGKQLWGGAQKGLDAWVKWTGSTRGQNDMRKYFHDMLPTLRAFKNLVEALGRAFVGLTGPAGQSGATALINSMTKLVGPLAMLLSSTAQDAPLFQNVVVAIGKVIAGLSKIPLLRHGLELAFGATIIGGFVAKLSGAVTVMSRLTGLFRRFRGEQRLAGMASPGTGGGFFSRMMGRFRGRDMGGGLGRASFGSAREALNLSATWGVRSVGGPGSEANPLAVVMLGGGFGGGGGGGGGGMPSPSTVERDAAQAEKLGFMGRMGQRLRGVPLLGRAVPYLAKIPGLGSLGAGLGEAGAVAGGAGLLSKLGGFGSILGGAAKFAGPIGLLATAIPGIISFFSTKGPFANRLAAGANSIVSGVTFGLVSHLFGGTVTAAQQRSQGQQGAAKFMARAGIVNPLTGMPDLHRIDSRLANEWQQYRSAKTGTRDRFGQMIGQDPGKAQREAASIVALNKDAANQSAKSWQNMFQQGLSDPHSKPMNSMRNLTQGLAMQMQQLGGSGQKQLMSNMAQWGATIVAQNPQLKGPVDALNSWIEQRFQTMGQNVQIVNGNILTGSQQQWGQIYTALTNPMEKAQLKVSGLFGKIQQEAIGELMTMGLKRSDATMLLKNPASANQWMNWAQTGQSGGSAAPRGGIGNRKASGGRVMGKNLRDVYQFGSNMLGGGELVVNRHQEQDANARLMRHGEPTIGSIVNNVKTPHWAGASRRATGGYALPLPRGMMGGAWSIDMGVDINGGTSAIANQPLYAVAPGTVIQEGISGFGPNAPVLHLDTPIMGHGNVYYGHAGADTVKIGQHVGAGQQISRVGAGIVGMSSGPHLEIGFGPPFSTGGDMNKFLREIMSGRTVAQTGMTGGVAGGLSARGRKPVRLRVPSFGGIGGVPQVLAGRAASAYAKTLERGLNKGLGSASGAGFAGRLSGSVENQVEQFFGSHGFNKVAVAGMLGNALQESAMHPNTPGGGLWQQISNFGGGTGGSLLHQMQTMLPQIMSIRGALNTSGSPGRAAALFMNSFERPAAATANLARRIAGANSAFAAGYDGGGRIHDAGWFRDGGSFVTKGPTVFGAGEGGQSERVTVEPAGASHRRPVHIEIHHIEVNREGDVRKIVDQELQLLAEHMVTA